MDTNRREAPGPLAAARRRQKRAWMVAGLSIAALAVATVVVVRADRIHSHHPTPRAVSQQPQVVHPAQYAQYPRVAQSYEMAAAVPMILDGLYCYCNCAEHSGHHSLLDCFASDHAARCDVCMSEAMIAYEMSRNGASLDDIRAEVDRTYGT